jgi:hypothetical protein
MKRDERRIATNSCSNGSQRGGAFHIERRERMPQLLKEFEFKDS